MVIYLYSVKWFCTSAPLSDSCTSARIGVTLRNSPSISDHERKKIVGTLTVITIIFIVVFGPYHMVGGYRFVVLLLTEDQCTLERSIYLYYRICYGLTSLNTLLDPLFYIFLCQNARLELQRSLPCLTCPHRSEGPWLLTQKMYSCQGQTGFFVYEKNLQGF